MSKPRCHFHLGISAGAALYAAVTASGLKAARARIRLEHGTLEPVVPMQREKPKRGNREGQSTDAGHRGGTIRSSEEGSVMGPERRGRVIQFLVNRSIPMQVGRGAHG
jgi:hypothetical protein